jgi:phage shock protein A
VSMFKRMSQVFQQKANSVLDKVEDPNQALDLSYQQMLEQLQKVKRGIAEVLTSQKRLEAQRDNLKAQQARLQDQARQALQQNREDLARTALTRAQGLDSQIQALEPQIAQLQAQEQALEDSGQKLSAKVEAFRSQRDVLKAQYTAAKASTTAAEGISGIGEQMADISLMMDRAKDKVANMQARAAAVGELADNGALDLLSLDSGDDIERELRSATAGASVEGQLEAMKASLGALPASGPAGALAAGQASPPASSPASASAMADPLAGFDVAAPTPAPPTPETGGVSVRIAGEDQYLLPESARVALETMDEALVRAVSTGDEAEFTKMVNRVISYIRQTGTKLPKEDARPSDVIVPPADTTLADAKKMLDDSQRES